MPPKPRNLPALLWGWRDYAGWWKTLEQRFLLMQPLWQLWPLPPGIRGGWSLSRGGVWTNGLEPRQKPKRPAISGLWWGLLWVYLGFSMIFFCWFKVQTTGLFRWWKNIFPTVEMVFTHRWSSKLYPFHGRETRLFTPPPGKTPRMGKRQITRRQGICWPGDSGLGQPSWCFCSKVLCQWIFKAWLIWVVEEILRSIFFMTEIRLGCDIVEIVKI